MGEVGKRFRLSAPSLQIIVHPLPFIEAALGFLRIRTVFALRRVNRTTYRFVAKRCLQTPCLDLWTVPRRTLRTLTSLDINAGDTSLAMLNKVLRELGGCVSLTLRQFQSFRNSLDLPLHLKSLTFDDCYLTLGPLPPSLTTIQVNNSNVQVLFLLSHVCVLFFAFNLLSKKTTKM